MAKRSGRRRQPRARNARRSGRMVFGRKNYVLLMAGVAAIIVGYVMMRLDNQVDGFISLYVSPIIILAGYLEIIWAILASPDGEVASSDAG